MADNPDIAESFGFDTDEIPSDSTFRPARITTRFDALLPTLNTAAKDIRAISAECGASIGFDLGKIETGDTTDDDVSKRTVDRLLRRKGKEVLTELKEVAFPALSLSRPENPIYDTETLLETETVAAIEHEAANGAGESMGDLLNPDPELDDPFYEDGPTGETLLSGIKDKSIEEIGEMMNAALRKVYLRAKPRLRELETKDGFRFGTRAQVALDITYVAYYGEREGMKFLQGTPDGKEYEWCHKFGTVAIAGENTHYIVGVVPLGSEEYADTVLYPGEDQSYYIGDVTRRLLSIADEYVNISRVYADREFYAADVIAAFEKRNLTYVVPAPKDDRIKRKCRKFHRLKRGYDEEHDTPLYVEDDWVIHGQVKQGVTNNKVYTNLVFLPPDEDDETHESGSPQPFATNLDVDDEIALDRRRARHEIEKYNDRGAIENSYSSVKEAAAWTTSKAFEVRWFHFAFGCVVYNMWLLVDFLTQERLVVVETRKKPRIRLSRFLRWLEKELVTLL